MYVWSRKRTDSRQNAVLLRLWAAVLIAAYGAAVLLFYWLAGEQLHLRASRSNRDLRQADSGTAAITQITYQNSGCPPELFGRARRASVLLAVSLRTCYSQALNVVWAGLLPLRRIKKFDMHQAFLRGSCNGRIKRPCAIEFYTDAFYRSNELLWFG